MVQVFLETQRRGDVWWGNGELLISGFNGMVFGYVY